MVLLSNVNVCIINQLVENLFSFFSVFLLYFLNLLLFTVNRKFATYKGLFVVFNLILTIFVVILLLDAYSIVMGGKIITCSLATTSID